MRVPKVSVIVPVYNAEQFLPLCIDSILKQVFINFELLLIDDGSSDKSGPICEKYARQDKRIRVYHKSNGGVSSARNIGIEKAKGEWVAFVDSDDWVSENYLSDMIDDIIDDNMLIFHDLYEDLLINLEKKVVEREDMVKYFVSHELMRKSGPVAKLYNNQILKQFNIQYPEEIHMGEDAIFILRYINHIDKIGLSDKKNYFVRKHKGSLRTRYYDFTSEWKCYILWKNELNLFVSRYENVFGNPEEIIWQNRIGDTFIRCVQSLLRTHEKMDFKDKIITLENIPEYEINQFQKYYFPKGLKRKIIKCLIVKKHFILLMILEKCYSSFYLKD